MKKLILIAAAAVALAASAASPASALSIVRPGCCGGCNPGGGGFHQHWGGGLSIGISLDSGYAGDCYYLRRKVLVPGMDLVSRRQMVCN